MNSQITDRIVSQSVRTQEPNHEVAIRPQTLADYTGQDAVCEQLHIFIEAARR
ncbi:MAG TPA: Holliday junction branch migration DNA helicase RuvB, partial [Candidatus Berkiella sp.]|nr:Holliday junction branch migration DNA helicase RuvB [Candidatus Berkiella sp.]